MKIGVISDTHDRLPTFARAVAELQRREVEAMLHAGDYVAPFAAQLIAADAPGMADLSFYGIYGNNDGEREGLQRILPGLVDGPMRLQLGGRTLVMHHFEGWLQPGETDDVDVVITGHTHQIVNETRDGMLWLNPGECCGWVTGRCTVAELDLATLAAEIIDIPTHPAAAAGA